MASDPLETIRELSTLHRTALTTLHQNFAPPKPAAPAYETIAEELASGMLSIAMGVDPVGVLIDLQESWLALADESDGAVAKVFTSWALQLESS